MFLDVPGLSRIVFQLGQQPKLTEDLYSVDLILTFSFAFNKQVEQSSDIRCVLAYNRTK